MDERPRTVGELAAAHGIDLNDLLPGMGTFPPSVPVAARYAWDMHHEAPVTSAGDLARRELIWPSPAGDARAVAARIRAGETAFAADPPVDALELAAALGIADPHARTVDVHMASWRMDLGGVQATLDRAPTGEPLPPPPAAAARRLGGGERVVYVL